MSVVVVRDGVMAADSGARMGSIKRQAKKLYRLDDAIIGFAGALADGLTFVDWWRDGKPAKTPEFRQYRGDEDAPDVWALVLTQDGVSLWTEHFQGVPVDIPFFAVGSGAMAALGAMHMGADAPEAAGIACLVASGCDLPIISERIDQ